MHYQRPRDVVRDHLSLQETTALLQTQAARMEQRKENTYRWQIAVRDLAILCATIATGRRIGGVCLWTVADVNCAASDIRVEREKGQKGRVLPLTEWAVAALDCYLTKVRPYLVSGDNVPHLFLNRTGDGLITRDALKWILKELLVETI